MTDATGEDARMTGVEGVRVEGDRAGVLRHRAAYLAFDRFPSTKGSAVHIGQMAAELFDTFGGGLLGVLGGGLPRYQREGDVEIVRFAERIPNLMDRAEAYSAWAGRLLAPHLETLRVVHVRDPWGALPAITAGGRHRLVYEVNGLPSIEMTHTWPSLAPVTLAKLRELEDFCLDHADAVVVPSAVIGATVAARGVLESKITLVPNGADPAPRAAPGDYLIYVGALQPWQGVDVLLRAFARLADLTELRLVICSSVPEKRARPLQRLAERIGVAERVDWRFQLPHDEVAGWLAGAAISVAPLTGCARNLDQGCAPLKILESMAAGVPVVASDLPAVRELMTDGEHGRLITADRPAELARTLRVLLEYPDAGRAMGERARARIADGLTWRHSRDRLAEVYRTLG